MIKKITFFIFIFLFLFLFSLNGNPQFGTPIGAEIDIACLKNIEAVCTLINLTDYWEKRHTDFPFAAEARDHFLPFKEHEAVKITAALLEKGWWQIYFFNIAVHITDLPEGDPKSAPEWFRMEPVQKFIPALRKFYKDSEYEKFWKEKRNFYKELQTSLARRYKEQNIDVVEIMEDFYGFGFDAYHIVPAPQLTDMGLHAELRMDDQSIAFYFNGPLGKDKSQKYGDYFAPVNALIYTAFHEFGHSFLEPVLQNNKDLLKKYSYIYKTAERGMEEKGYSSWGRVFAENLIHAAQICLMEKAWNRQTALKTLNQEYENGFILIKDMFDILQDYVGSRDKYERIQDFMPVFFESLGKRYRSL